METVRRDAMLIPNALGYRRLNDINVDEVVTLTVAPRICKVSTSTNRGQRKCNDE